MDGAWLYLVEAVFFKSFTFICPGFLIAMDCLQVDIMQQCVNLQLETGQHNHEVRFFGHKNNAGNAESRSSLGSHTRDIYTLQQYDEVFPY